MGTAAGIILWKTSVKAHALFGIDGNESIQKPEDVKWEDVRKDIVTLIESNSDYDDGSYGPLLVRLAWHQCGTYCQYYKDGGSDGATMRFKPECSDDANNGLDIARSLMEGIRKKHPEASYTDLWTYAGGVAIEEMGGPEISWRPGRTDSKSGDTYPPVGRLPDGARGEDHIRAVFYRLGFGDEEIVALIGGGHALGRCHNERSGFHGPWTFAPTTFSNEFFRLLLEEKWNGNPQFEDSTGELVMLPTDIALIQTPDFKKFVVKFAKDEAYFFQVFSKAWTELMELGTNIK
ncbi:hypothetical protein LOD99_7670 [Oopsacas minuta]|uniref:Cytochrome c peroxidase, mitochondrial n=1 Tax=Oopsacas minuta TaxID=111878 RepID=A0AAV7JQC8_9METZ|nr:hypothetical protein LOD99_7670 [Oopsacas minuta]